jgi:hypothetical protein
VLCLRSVPPRQSHGGLSVAANLEYVVLEHGDEIVDAELAVLAAGGRARDARARGRHPKSSGRMRDDEAGGCPAPRGPRLELARTTLQNHCASAARTSSRAAAMMKREPRVQVVVEPCTKCGGCGKTQSPGPGGTPQPASFSAAMVSRPVSARSPSCARCSARRSADLSIGKIRHAARLCLAC